jgi:hypothetical protein
MSRTLFSFFLCAVFFQFTGTLTAFQLPDPGNAVSSGMGSAYTACENTPETVFFNPAAHFAPGTLKLDINYNLFLSGMTAEQNIGPADGYFAVNVSEWSIAAVIPAGRRGGLGASFSSTRYNSLRDYRCLGVSYSYDLGPVLGLSRTFAVGIGFKYLIDRYLPDSYSLVSADRYGSIISGFSTGLGILVKITESLNAAAVLDDLVTTDIGFSRTFNEPVLLRAGVCWNPSGMNGLKLTADFGYGGFDFLLAAGAELPVKDTGLTLSCGINTRYVSAGVTYGLLKKIRIVYAVNVYLTGFSPGTMNHRFGLGFGM